MRWWRLDGNDWNEISSAIRRARKAIEAEPPKSLLECQFEIAEFMLNSTSGITTFERTIRKLQELGERLWQVMAPANEILEEEAGLVRTRKPGTKPKASHKAAVKLQASDFKKQPTTTAKWINRFQQIGHHKPLNIDNPFNLANVLLRISDVRADVAMNIICCNCGIAFCFCRNN
jgi:hypothetical protein